MGSRKNKPKKSLDLLKMEVQFEEVKKSDFVFPTDLDLESSANLAVDDLREIFILLDHDTYYRDVRVQNLMDEFRNIAICLVSEYESKIQNLVS